MLDQSSVIQVYSLIFGAVVVAIVGGLFKLMFGISSSLKTLTEKTTQILTRIDYHESDLSDLKSRVRIVEKSGCSLAKHGQCLITP